MSHLNKGTGLRKRKALQWPLLLILSAALTLWSMWQTGFNPLLVSAGLGDTISYIYNDFLPPDWFSARELIKPLMETIYMSFAAMVISALVSIALALLSSDATAPNKQLQSVIRTVTAVLRTIPEIIWVLLLVSSIGLGPMAGTFALMLAGIGLLTRCYSDVLDEMDRGQLEASRAVGAKWLQTVGQCVIPQFLPGFIAWSLYMLDLNIRSSAVIGMAGGGGLGFAIQEGIKLFQFQKVTMAIILVLVLILAIEWLTEHLRSRLIGENQKSRTGNRLLFTVLIGCSFFFLFSVWKLKFQLSELWTGFGGFVDMLLHLFPPSFADWTYVLSSALESFYVAVVGTALAIVLSLGMSFLAASNLSPNRGVLWIVKGFASLMRAIPMLVWALVFIVSIGMGPLAGILALAIHSMGMLIKVFAESIEEVDKGKIEALRAVGAGWLTIITQAVFPMAAGSILSWSLLRLEIDIRYSTILGVVGAGGIGYELTRAMKMYKLDEAMFILIVVFFMVYAVDWLGRYLKRTLIR